MRARLADICWQAEGINSYILEPLEGESFPPFTAGSHIDVQLAPGLSRSYSLVNDPEDGDHFEIAVHHAIDGRGGSRHIHELWQAGQVLEISAPKNNFPLEEAAAHTVLIAGGIGITPMLPMIVRLERLGRSWALHYVAATPARAAFVDRLSAHPQARVTFDGVPDGKRLDLQAICEAAPADAHLYCCGPKGMLDAFLALTAGRPRANIHIEYFSADTDLATDGGFTVECRKSGVTVAVKKGKTILESLLATGIDLKFSCTEGVCGTCETNVIEGEPDHRDQFLTDEEKASNASMMICCSGSKSPKLVLDL